MLCSMSGQAPLNPVVSRKSGHLFERALVEKSIRESGLCPITGEPLHVDDLMSVQSNAAVRPRNVATTSIPGLLATFQNEWDEVMLEVFTLKQHLDTTRKELSQALYQHDAACRVIARLMRERDEARAMLTNGGGGPVAPPTAAAAAAVAAGNMDVEGSAPTGAGSTAHDSWGQTVASISSRMLELNAARKQRARKVPESTRAKESFANMQTKATSTPHKTSSAGVTCLALAHDGSHILTGGADKDLHVLNAETGKSTCKVSGAHKENVTSVAMHADATKGLFLSGSADTTVKLWSLAPGAKKAEAVSTFDVHSRAVTAVRVHPEPSIAVSFSEDGTFACLDLNREVCALRVGDASTPSPEFSYRSGAVHPDAVIVAGGTSEGAVEVWDIRQQMRAVNLADHSGNGVTAVDFSNNGYYVCTGDADGDLRLWDLRKVKCVHSERVGAGALSSIQFDNYGMYAAVGGCGDQGHGVQLWHVKDWTCMANLGDIHAKLCTGAAWGPDAQYVVSSGMDKTVKIFA